MPEASAAAFVRSIGDALRGQAQCHAVRAEDVVDFWRAQVLMPVTASRVGSAR